MLIPERPEQDDPADHPDDLRKDVPELAREAPLALGHEAANELREDPEDGDDHDRPYDAR